MGGTNRKDEANREFRTLASREHRGCFGKSSGGYGAIIHGMKYAKYWGAIADHSGDAYFDFAYWHDWPNTLNELMKYRVPKRRAGVYDALREARRKGLDKGLDDGRIKLFRRINRTCMVATYDPDPGAPNGFRIPFIAESGEVLR